MAALIPNEYHLRTVAETSSKSCFVCHKPSTKVLITPDNKDFFYICPSHLKDRGFTLPVLDEKAEAEKRQREALREEIEAVKKEYEEKQKGKKKKKDGDEKKKEDDDSKAERERDEKIKAIENKADSGKKPAEDDGPRIFTLHKNFYQMRLDRLRNIEKAKREQQRIKDPTFFPSTPKGNVS